MKLAIRIFGVAALCLVLCGCATNNYMSFFSSLDKNRAKCEIKKVRYPHVEELVSKDEVYAWRAKGYEVIGESSFCDKWKSRTAAIDVARKIGAEVVLVYSKLESEETKTTTINVPQTTTTYQRGTMYRNNRSWNYSETTTSTTYVPTQINYTERFYAQQAYFLARRSVINSFGVYFVEPLVVPGQPTNVDSAIVDVVIAGSPAEKAGLAPGDKVVGINGAKITSFKDVQKYMNGEVEIREVEVANEND